MTNTDSFKTPDKYFAILIENKENITIDGCGLTFVNGGDFEYDPAITETTRQTMFCYTYQFLKPEECVIEYQGHTYRMPEKV